MLMLHINMKISLNIPFSESGPTRGMVPKSRLTHEIPTLWLCTGHGAGALHELFKHYAIQHMSDPYVDVSMQCFAYSKHPGMR